MPKNNDDLSNEILALVDDDLMKDDSSDGGRPRRRVKSGNDSDSELSASSSDFSVNSEDRRRRNNRRINQESSSDEEDMDLDHLTEIEREQIIAEKAEKNQKKLEEQEILSRLSKQKKTISRNSRALVQESDEGSDKEFVPSSRPHRTKSSQSQALKELKDHRIKKKNQALSRSEDSTEDEEETKFKTSRQQTPIDEVDTSPPVTSLEQLQKIILTREALAALLHDRMLKKMVVGCFVSVARDPKPDGTQVYRLGKITDVIETSHHYNVERTRTHRMIILSHGADSMEFSFDVISNRPSTEVELERYLDSCKKANIAPITLNYVKKKEEELITLKGRVNINEDYEYSIRSNRISSDNPKVHLNFKKHLISQIRLAKENDQPEVAADLEAELIKVEKDLAPLLDKYELEVQSTRVLVEEKKDQFRKIVVSAAQATKKDLDAERKRKRWVDSDDEAGKDNCFNLKAPRLSPKEPYVFPPLDSLAFKSDNDSIPLTAWEQAAAQAMSL